MSFTTSPLTANTTVIGAGAVHVWLKASTPSVDLQATITELRPDRKETFVQNAWVRANEPECLTGSGLQERLTGSGVARARIGDHDVDADHRSVR